MRRLIAIGGRTGRPRRAATVSGAGRASRYRAPAGLAALFTCLAFASPSPADDGTGIPTERSDLTPKDRARVEAVTRPTTDFSKAETFEVMQGGAATSRKLVNRDAFSQSSANLDFAQERDFKLGNALFRKLWVSSPSSTQASDGLGPLFNARACQSCHLKDGRGHPPDASGDATSLLLRLARAPRNPQEQGLLKDRRVLNFGDPVYGGQFQDLAVPGLRGEGKVKVEWETFETTLADGTVVPMRKPDYTVEKLAYGPMDVGTTLSPRIATPMIGLGLVEQIHPVDMLALADPEDSDGDGISGRVNIVRDAATGDLAIGRFGWKASAPTIRQQSAEAFAADIGISTPDLPHHHGECTRSQPDCLAAPTGVQQRLGDSEAPDPVLDLVTFYSQNLAVPARRDVDDPQVLRGKRVFHEIGCASCHVPKFVTRRDAPEEHLAFQLIWPYSDFLLHDLGLGLTDWQPVGDARVSEWRTPPLWGIGLTGEVSGHTFFLHDGRARSLTEAILWHGGEAEAARDGFAGLAKADRDALIRFLESL